MRLTLLIPELLWSEPGDSEAWAGTAGTQLPKFLASRRPEVMPAAAWETALAELAGLGDGTSLAALRAAGEPEAPFSEIPLDKPALAESTVPGNPSRWLCADPVHLRFHQDRLILADAAELALSAAEREAIAAELDTRLAPYRFRFAGNDRAYLLCPGPPCGAQRPLSQKVGCEVRPSDLGADAELRRLANEVQMLLHAHPVNSARESAGQATINALWLWGTGTNPAPVAATSRIARFLAHGAAVPAILNGIARLHAAPAEAFGTGLRGRLAAAAGKPAHPTLLLSTALLRPAQYQDAAAWAAAWSNLDREVFAPALDALVSGRVSELSLVAPSAFGVLRWSLHTWPARFARWLPMRRPPLSSLAAALAGPSRPNTP